MATGGHREPRAGGTEAAGERRVLEELRELLELRQRQLRSRIAACEELTAAMTALRAALGPEEPREIGAPPRDRGLRSVWGSGSVRAVPGESRDW